MSSRLPLPAPVCYSIKQASAYIQMSETYLRRAIHRGDLEATKIGGSYRIYKHVLDRWLRENLYQPRGREEERRQPRAPRRERGKPQRLTW